MIVYDFEVFKYDWMVCWLDLKTKEKHHIVNNKQQLEKMFNYYNNTVWIGYNSRDYDQWILKAILCDFNPYEMSDWIINKGNKGFEFSNLLNKFQFINYDCLVKDKSLKELEAFMGHDIRETSVPFDIDRKLTNQEIEETLKYCNHDVWETFNVFVQTKEEWESHLGLIQEFNLPFKYLSKTKPQLSAIILGAERQTRMDEFDVSIPKTVQLGKYKWLENHYVKWANECKALYEECYSDKKAMKKLYNNLKLDAIIGGIPTKYGIGGIHGSKDNYIGEGYYLMPDVNSYYPALMIEYDYLSRNVKDKRKFRVIRDERIVMKSKGDKRQKPRKTVLNSTYGASKDKCNALYDPLQANNVCIAGQLLLTDLVDKLDGKCEFIQYNTDGILIKLYNESDVNEIKSICKDWEKRTGMSLDFPVYRKVIQKDVSNYILIDDNGGLKRKGSYVQKLSPLNNDLPIINKAIVNYLVYGISVEKTINECNTLIDFQKVTKITKKYNYCVHNGEILNEKVHRCFASLDQNDGTLYKKHKDKTTLDKTPSTPEHCFIINDNILDMPIPSKLDKQWYIDLANDRINDFIGKKRK